MSYGNISTNKLYVGSSPVTGLYKGSTKIYKVYKGSTLVFAASDLSAEITNIVVSDDLAAITCDVALNGNGTASSLELCISMSDSKSDIVNNTTIGTNVSAPATYNDNIMDNDAALASGYMIVLADDVVIGSAQF